MYPAYDLNHAYEETDVFVSLAKLKNHATCGVTLSLKNCFGNLPASIYGEDAGVDEPNESPTRPPGTGATKAAASPRNRPRRSCILASITTRLSRARTSWRTWPPRAPSTWPLSMVWNPSRAAKVPGSPALRIVKPGLLIAGLNPVATDAVSSAVMGYNPRAARGTAPFQTCDNTLLLAEAHGVGTADLKRIEVRGVSIEQALYRYDK